MDWIQLLSVIGGSLASLSGIGLYKMFTKSGQREMKADADAKVAKAQEKAADAQMKMIDNYEKRIDELHAHNAKLNEEVQYYIERLSELNKVINGKVDRIRELTDMLNNSELEINKVNDRLVIAQKKITDLTQERDFFKMWHCKSNKCVKGSPDPEGRQPPNPKLVGMTFPGSIN